MIYVVTAATGTTTEDNQCIKGKKKSNYEQFLPFRHYRDIRKERIFSMRM